MILTLTDATAPNVLKRASSLNVFEGTTAVEAFEDAAVRDNTAYCASCARAPNVR